MKQLLLILTAVVLACCGQEPATVEVRKVPPKLAEVTEKPLPKDFKSLRALAEKGNSAAQTKLAEMYYNGHGVEEDDEEAKRWIQKSADQGYARAQVILGTFYLKGAGVKKDHKEAAKWNQKAAEQGDAEAQSKLQFLLKEHPELRED